VRQTQKHSGANPRRGAPNPKTLRRQPATGRPKPKNTPSPAGDGGVFNAKMWVYAMDWEIFFLNYVKKLLFIQK
jgi:hypothetical protein